MEIEAFLYLILNSLILWFKNSMLRGGGKGETLGKLVTVILSSQFTRKHFFFRFKSTMKTAIFLVCLIAAFQVIEMRSLVFDLGNPDLQQQLSNYMLQMKEVLAETKDEDRKKRSVKSWFEQLKLKHQEVGCLKLITHPLIFQILKVLRLE